MAANVDVFVALGAGVLLGVAVTLLALAYIAWRWVLVQPLARKSSRPAARPQGAGDAALEAAMNAISESANASESCRWLNVAIVQAFRDVHQAPPVRRWVLRRITREIEWIMVASPGKIIEDIRIADFSLGRAPPVVSSATIANDSRKDGYLDLILDVVYDGRASIALQVDFRFGLQGTLSITAMAMAGKLRLRLSRDPVPCWSLAFCEEPRIQWDVESSLAGRDLPNIAALIIGQINRSIRRKHTLPSYRVRPWFSSMTGDVAEAFLPGIQIDGRPLGRGTLDILVVGVMDLPRTRPGSTLLIEAAITDGDSVVNAAGFRDRRRPARTSRRYRRRTTAVDAPVSDGVVSVTSFVRWDEVLSLAVDPSMSTLSVKLLERITQGARERDRLLGISEIAVHDLLLEMVAFPFPYRQGYRLAAPDMSYDRSSRGDIILEFVYTMSAPGAIPEPRKASAASASTVAADGTERRRSASWEDHDEEPNGEPQRRASMPHAQDVSEHVARKSARRRRASSVSPPRNRSRGLEPILEGEAASDTPNGGPRTPSDNGDAEILSRQRSSSEGLSTQDDPDELERQYWHRFAGFRPIGLPRCDYCTGIIWWGTECLRCQSCRACTVHKRCLRACLRASLCSARTGNKPPADREERNMQPDVETTLKAAAIPAVANAIAGMTDAVIGTAQEPMSLDDVHEEVSADTTPAQKTSDRHIRHRRSVSSGAKFRVAEHTSESRTASRRVNFRDHESDSLDDAKLFAGEAPTASASSGSLREPLLSSGGESAREDADDMGEIQQAIADESAHYARLMQKLEAARERSSEGGAADGGANDEVSQLTRECDEADRRLRELSEVMFRNIAHMREASGAH